jgi:hypothetical protein
MIAGLAVLAVLTGRLIPSRTVDRELRGKQAEIDRLTAALDKAENQRDRLMFGVADVTVGVMKSLPTAPEWVVTPPKDPVS